MPQTVNRSVAVDIAGIMDALRRQQFADHDGEARYTTISEAVNGFVGICDAVIDAAEAMEAFRLRVGEDVRWGEQLPHPYEAWEALADALWREMDSSSTAKAVERALLRLVVCGDERP